MATKAFEQVWKSITGVPDVDLTTKRYTFVNYQANGNINVAAAGGAALGVLYEPNKAGQSAQVVTDGFAFVVLGAAVAAGQEVQSDAAGAAIVLAAGRPLGICAVGGATGDIATVKLK